MKTKHIKRKGTLLSSVAVLSTAMLLTACGGDGGDSPVDDFGSNPGEGDNQALLYAYPDNGQGEISTAAPVVLRFSSAVNLGQAQNSITLYEGDAETGTVVNTTPESVAKEPNNVLLQPDEDLKPNQTYTVVIEDLRLRKGVAKDQTLTFTTRPLNEGPKDLVVKKDTFEVSRHMPDGSEMEPVMDFSSFRFQFTQPVDRATATYGDSVTLTSSGGDTVDATLLIDGAYMTVDPDAEYLNAGETYTLDITADLASTYGQTFGARSYTFTPKDSSPGRDPAILVQKLTQGNTSRLTGKPINQVPVNGTLLGEDDNITQASAEVVRAELADVTTYTDVTPIRLPKGTVLNGAEINPILIGGEVPAGFGSGDVTMTVLSDASGYLVPNPYAENNPDALRIVHLLMDVGIATSEARANGAFTQDLLHIELVGLAEVDPEAGVLNLDAVSMVEPNILGQEYGYGMLSFQLQSYKDQNNAPEVAPDTVAPTLQSWVPGDTKDSHKPSDPVIFTFDEPIDPATVAQSTTLLIDEGSGYTEVDSNVEVDGASLVIRPETALKYNLQNSTAVYRVEIGAVSDLEGNTTGPITETFSLADVVTDRVQVYNPNTGQVINETIPVEQRSPFILSMYPGFPCAKADMDLQNGDAGRCVNSFPGFSQGTEIDVKQEDDHFPIPEMPSNRPIKVYFSRTMNPESIQLGSTFIVQRIDAQSGDVLDDVQGQLSFIGRELTFKPDQPWEPGALYQYVLKSNGDGSSSTADCSGVGAICDERGLPLQTSLLPELAFPAVRDPSSTAVRDFQLVSTPRNPSGGGQDLVQPFVGTSATRNVLQFLVASPVSDSNSNLIHDADMEIDDDNDFTTFFSVGLNPTPAVLPYQYEAGVGESQAYDQPGDPNADPQYDPNGVAPPPNASKLLSRDVKGNANPGANLNGFDVGCAFAGYEKWVPDDPDDSRYYPVAKDCPAQKFLYLNGGLTAEVTDEYIEGKGLKVLVWPSHITTTSLLMAVQGSTNQGGYIVATGNSLLRMRFEEDGSGDRVNPITGWIGQGIDGKPVLEVDVDLYLDGLNLSETLNGAYPGVTPTHNLVSHPISMNLSGEIDFLDDGRMLIEQYNVNDVDTSIDVYNERGSLISDFPIRIPAHGTRLQYLTNSIK